ncbi:hypothetical protein ACRRTK_016075 [Alexandromys fortis]
MNDKSSQCSRAYPTAPRYLPTYISAELTSFLIDSNMLFLLKLILANAAVLWLTQFSGPFLFLKVAKTVCI